MLLFLLVPGFASAPWVGAAQTPAERVQAQIQVLLWDEAPGFRPSLDEEYVQPEQWTRLHWYNEGEPLALDLLPGQPSRMVRYSGPPVLNIYDRGVDMAVNEEPPSPVASVSVPSGSGPARKYLLVLKPSGSKGYAALIVPLEGTDANPGSVVLVNLTRYTLACRTDGDVSVLPPGKSAVATPLDEAEDPYMNLIVARQDDDHWKPVIRTRRVIPKGGNTTYILTDMGIREGHIRLMAVDASRSP